MVRIVGFRYCGPGSTPSQRTVKKRKEKKKIENCLAGSTEDEHMYNLQTNNHTPW